MKRLLGAAVIAVLVAAGGPARADEKEARAVVDRAITAMGGEEKLAKFAAASWKAAGKMTFNDNTNDFSSKVTVQGTDRYRSEFEGEFNGNAVKGVIVLAGDKGWWMFGDNLTEMEGDALANQKRNAYLQAVPTLLLPLKGQGFRLDSAPDEAVAGKPAAVVKVTGPDGKDFRLSFDKESGLPVKLVATVAGFQGNEFTQETTFAAYKDFAGVKKATKIVSKRDGERYMEQDVTDFQPLEKAPAGTFDEPK